MNILENAKKEYMIMSDFVKIGVVGLNRGLGIAASCDGEKGVIHAICDINPERIKNAIERLKAEKAIHRRPALL